MKRLFLCFCFLLAVIESIPFQSLGQQLLEEHSVDYLRDPSHQLTVTDLFKSNDFRPLKNTFFRFGKDSSNHWLRFELNNEGLTPRKIVIEIAQPYLDEVGFFVTNNQGITLNKSGEILKLFSENRSYSNRHFIFKSFLPPAQKYVYFIRIFKKYMHITGTIKVWDDDKFIEKENTQNSLMGLFSGFLLTNFIISILLLTITKDRLYSFYASYIFFSGLSFIMVGGYFFRYYQQGFWGVPGAEVKNLPLLLSQVSLLFFIKNYVLPNYRLSGLALYNWWITLCLQGIVFILLNLLFLIEKYGWPIPNAVLLFITISFFWPVLTGFYLIILSLVKKVEPQAAKTYLIGIAPMLVYSILSYVRNLDIIPDHLLLSQEIRSLLFGFDILVLMIGLGYRYKALRDEKDQQKQLIYENQLKLWQEKERISRDLHDNVGSQLTIVSSGLDNALYLSEHNKLSSKNLESINQNVRDAVQSLRDTIWVTHQTRLRVIDLKIRVQHYLQKAFSDTTALKVYFNCSVETTELSSAQALNTFRIIQEAVQNIQKYAFATIINVEIHQKEQTLYVKIEDNGVGFSLKDVDLTEHYGLQNMQKRAQEMKGQLSLQTMPSQGTVINLMLPLDNLN